MKHATFIERLKDIWKDILIIISIFILCTFVSVRTASLVATILTVILLIRRFAFDLNPLASEKYVIDNGIKLVIPPHTEIFELNDSSSFESLLKYASFLQSIAIPPKILIIRFCKISYLRDREFRFLDKILKVFLKRNIIIIFSDVSENIKGDLQRGGIL